jgi:hypothetical protein
MHRNASTLALGLALLIAIPTTADAQTPERPFYVGGGAGVALELDRYPTQAMLIEQIGWHFLGTTDGPFVELSLAESFGSDVFTFQAAPRLGWDIAVLRGGDVGLLLAPSVAAGIVYAQVTVNTPFGSARASDTAFDLQGAFDLKLLLLDDQLEIFFRPIAVDVFIDSDAVSRWNVLAGAHYRF